MKQIVLLILLLVAYNQVLAQTDTIINSSNHNNQTQGLDMLAAGYQLGGNTYFGFEYEYRISKFIGINIGTGVLGFTGGFKLHFCPCRTGPFLNISFKDSGFGKKGSLNIEFGGNLLFFDKSEKFGLMGQIGIGKMIYQSTISKEKPTTGDMILSFGIGFNRYFN